MSSERPLTVFIYKDQASLINKWTLQYPAIETGGDLFGLWRNESEVVVQVVLGPGKGCRRTPTSFFQDEGYLNAVGGHLTAHEGLCNIGAWHSHHKMNLPEPSRGDAETIWKHLPTPGRFVLLIASIETGKDGTLHCVMTFSLFDSAKKRMLRMNCKILEGRSPLPAKPMINDVLLSRAEDPKINGVVLPRAEDGPRREERRYNAEKFSESNTCEGRRYCHFQELWYTYYKYKDGCWRIYVSHTDPRIKKTAPGEDRYVRYIYHQRHRVEDIRDDDCCMIL